MENNIKVALCLHGMFDSKTDSSSLGINGYNYIKQHILDKFDTDVYIHNWDVDKADMIKQMYNPINFVFKSRFDLGQINRRTSPYNVECINFNKNNPTDRINMAWWPDKWMLREG